MSWTTHGVDRLWMSPLSDPSQSDALRGGVPVLFPQFGTFGDLPKHGFARTSDWREVPAPTTPGRAALSFELTDSPATRGLATRLPRPSGHLGVTRRTSRWS